MSETINYWGRVTGFNKDEKEEIENVCCNFQEAMLDIVSDEEIVFQVENGWRGGGCSCEQLVKEHFKDFVAKKPHLKIEIHCTYVEHSPCEKITIENEKISSVMVGW